MRRSEDYSKITIIRGTHQIGGCATEYHRILIDLCANLPDTENDGITDDELFEKAFANPNCDAILFTHYHGDHIGLYKKASREIPMYISDKLAVIFECILQYTNCCEKSTNGNYYQTDSHLPADILIRPLCCYRI